MSWIQSMQEAIDFMEQHLLEDLSMDEVTKAAYTSPYHFQRIFSLLTGTTVAEYLRRRRLTLAAQELRKGIGKSSMSLTSMAMKLPSLFPGRSGSSTAYHLEKHGVTGER
ncbi:helix-turn-helix domain-containing protein [Halobacillus sp. GSS1]|uniref:helix-turn-helix domain-containing protein n=1 Tax=Halobacillus sp. GSS1 TaxID=2815919 RepID=UPI00351BFB2D